MQEAYTINELELSINNKCNLRCSECGFLIPNQPKPALTDNIIKEHTKCLEILCKNGIKIESLAILGGEPTLNAKHLETAVKAFSDLGNISKIEIVTNGLNPKGITENTLGLIKKISISVYADDKDFIECWKTFVSKKAQHINLAFRIQKEWDINSGDYTVTDNEAQKMFDECWYKKHCVSIERSRLFLCSIAPKHKSDSDGLLLRESTTRAEIISYLSRKDALHHCKNCIPQMHIKKVHGGVQNDKSNLQNLMDKAKSYFNSIG